MLNPLSSTPYSPADFATPERLARAVAASRGFARPASIRGIHECLFGTLALASEPVGPRL